MNRITDIIHLAIAFDQNFITPFYVLLTSIFENNQSNIFHIHTIASGVTIEEKEQLNQYVQNSGSQINFYEVNLKNFDAFVIPENSYFTVATYYRLFFPALVPLEVKKIIYLDTDTIVIAELNELFNLNIQNYPAAAAIDSAAEPRPDLGIVNQKDYFNAGVLLINIEQWNKQNISEKSLQYLKEFPEKIKWVDQDALNAVLINNFYKLDNRFNVTFYDIPIDLPKKEYTNYLKDKVIIHFTTGLHKPWSMLGENKFRYLYHNYLKKSPKSFEKKYRDFRLNKSSLYFFIKVRVIEYLYNTPQLANFLKIIKK